MAQINKVPENIRTARRNNGRLPRTGHSDVLEDHEEG